MTRNWPCFRWNSAWRRLTVMSSRKMPLSGWRPADVTGWSSKNREPALGPRVTMSSAEPLGNPSTSHIASPARAGAAASSSPRKSSRKGEVVSAASSSGGPSLSIRLTCCSLLANRQDQLCLTTKRDETNCPENIRYRDKLTSRSPSGRHDRPSPSEVVGFRHTRFVQPPLDPGNTEDDTSLRISAVNRPGMSGDSTCWEGWSHVRWFVEEV